MLPLVCGCWKLKTLLSMTLILLWCFKQLLQDRCVKSEYSHYDNLVGNNLVIICRVSKCFTLAGDCLFDLSVHTTYKHTHTKKWAASPHTHSMWMFPLMGLSDVGVTHWIVSSYCSQELQTLTSKSDLFCFRCGGGTLCILLDINHRRNFHSVGMKTSHRKIWSTLMIAATLVQSAL